MYFVINMLITDKKRFTCNEIQSNMFIINVNDVFQFRRTALMDLRAGFHVQ